MSRLDKKLAKYKMIGYCLKCKRKLTCCGEPFSGKFRCQKCGAVNVYVNSQQPVSIDEAGQGASQPANANQTNNHSISESAPAPDALLELLKECKRVIGRLASAISSLPINRGVEYWKESVTDAQGAFGEALQFEAHLDAEIQQRIAERKKL